jgi:hypothetical protein
MISVLTVCLQCHYQYLPMFLESLHLKTTDVGEVLILNISDYRTDFVPPRYYYFPIRLIHVDKIINPNKWGHAYGLHTLLEQAKYEYIWFSDNDVFFYIDKVDSFFLQCINQFKLSYLGITHYRNDSTAFGDFPMVTNLLCHRDSLPPDDFLRDEIVAAYPDVPPGQKSYYLYPVRLEKYVPFFQLPEGIYDPGVGLYIWLKQQEALGNPMKWMSFRGQHVGGSWDHSTHNLANNFGLVGDEFGDIKIAHHVMKANLRAFRWKRMHKRWEAVKKSDDDKVSAWN